LSGAVTLPIGGADQFRAGVINDVSVDDVYRIHLDKPATVTLKLTKLTTNATLQLISDRNCNNRFDAGELIQESSNKLLADETVTKILDPGNYCIRVAQASRRQNGRYELHYSSATFATPDQLDTAGNDSKTARVITPVIKNSFTLMEYIGGTDAVDYYRWDLAKASSASVRLNGLVFEGDLKLYYDKNKNGVADAGEVIGTTAGMDISDKVVRSALQAGTYFISVTASSNLPTVYSLRITP
jgi:hypothetical protein